MMIKERERERDRRQTEKDITNYNETFFTDSSVYVTS